MILRRAFFIVFVLGVFVLGLVLDRIRAPARSWLAPVLDLIPVPDRDWHAVRDLPANTRISSNEVQRSETLRPYQLLGLPSLSSLQGKYSTNLIPKGTVIKPEQLVATPQLAPFWRSSPDALFALTVQPLGSASPLLNAGGIVFVFDATNKLIEFGPYVIETVLGNETNCVLIRVPPVQAERLRKLSKPEIRLGTRVSTKNLNVMSDDINWTPVKSVKVPEDETTAWTPALDSVAPNRLYRLKVTSGKWKVDGTETSADGLFSATNQSQDLICKNAPFGALVAKLGGGTADASGTVFAVGRYCVYAAPTDGKPADAKPPDAKAPDLKASPLFLGANIPTNSSKKVEGVLTVDIEIGR